MVLSRHRFYIHVQARDTEMNYVFRDRDSKEEPASPKSLLSPTQVSSLVTRTPSFNKPSNEGDVADGATVSAVKPGSSLPAHLKPDEVGDLISRTPSFRYTTGRCEVYSPVFRVACCFQSNYCLVLP